MPARSAGKGQEGQIEARLRSNLEKLPPGTSSYQLALTELAEHLLDKGETETARQLFENAVAGRVLSPEGAQQRGRRQASAPEGASSSRRDSSGSGADDWENGDWEARLDQLSLEEKLPPRLSKDAANASPSQASRVPNSRRPAQMLFVPSCRPQTVGGPASDESSEDCSPPPNLQRVPQSEPPQQSNGKSRTPAESKTPRPASVSLSKPRARSQLARIRGGPQGDFPRGLDPPGLRDPEHAQPVPYEGRHVLEVMGLTTSDGDPQVDEYLKTIKEFPIRPVIRWATETQALVVFSEIYEAAFALEHAPEIGRLWLRPYDQASERCKRIAVGELQPPTNRPKTTAVVAKRLLFNALHNRSILDLDGERQIRAERKEKIAEKARRQRDLDAAWED